VIGDQHCHSRFTYHNSLLAMLWDACLYNACSYGAARHFTENSNCGGSRVGCKSVVVAVPPVKLD
jgi:hypothetical protein